MLERGTIQTSFDRSETYGNITPSIDVANYNMPISDCIVANKGDMFTINTTQSSLVASFDEGSQARIGGAFYLIKESASIELEANQTQYVCLEINTGNLDGNTGDIVLKTQSQISKGDLYVDGVRDLPIYKITTTSTGVSTIEDLRTICGNTYNVSETEYEAITTKEQYAIYNVYED